MCQGRDNSKKVYPNVPKERTSFVFGPSAFSFRRTLSGRMSHRERGLIFVGKPRVNSRSLDEISYLIAQISQAIFTVAQSVYLSYGGVTSPFSFPAGAG